MDLVRMAAIADMVADGERRRHPAQKDFQRPPAPDEAYYKRLQRRVDASDWLGKATKETEWADGRPVLVRFKSDPAQTQEHLERIEVPFEPEANGWTVVRGDKPLEQLSHYIGFDGSKVFGRGRK